MSVKQISLNIPTDWKDITIEKYQKYLKLVNSKRGNKKIEEGAIKLFCNISDSLLKKMKLKDRKQIASKIATFINGDPQKELERVVVFNGKEFGFIPNLNKITTGEYIDIEEYSKNLNDNLHSIMSVLYREVDKKSGEMYSIKPYDPDELTDVDFKQFPMSTTLSAVHFFFHLGRNLLRDFNSYLNREKMMEKKKLSQANGVGTV